MKVGRQGHQGARRGSWRALLAVALLVVVGLASAVGGASLWLHAHGHDGGHVHLVWSAHEHDGAARHDWHAAEHARDDSAGDREDVALRDVDHGAADRHAGRRADGIPAPEGLLLEVPEFVAAAPRAAPHVFAAVALALAHAPLPIWHAPTLEPAAVPRLLRPRRPPRETARSGVAVLLRSSHAILI